MMRPRFHAFAVLALAMSAIGTPGLGASGASLGELAARGRCLDVAGLAFRTHADTLNPYAACEAGRKSRRRGAPRPRRRRSGQHHQDRARRRRRRRAKERR